MKDKKISSTVSIECWKQLKIIGIQKGINLQLVVKDILEKVLNKKTKDINIEE